MHAQPATTEQSRTFRDLDVFSRFIRFFHGVFSSPGFLDEVACRESHKQYVPRYFANTFGPRSGLASAENGELLARHLKWFRRLEPVLEMPRGSTLVDYGGGYGMDTVFLAGLGYRVVFFEISPHHIAIARHFARLWGDHRGRPLDVRFLLRDRSRAGHDDFGEVDAFFLDEVAHHIEPAQSLFEIAARALKPGGKLFLLEPNAWSPVAQAYFFKVRGFKTTLWLTDDDTGERYLWGNEHIRLPFVWDRLASRSGFTMERRHRVVPFGLRTREGLHAPLRRALETVPIARTLVPTHVTSIYRRV